MDNVPTVLVIGGGIAGLSAATTLAEHGVNVVLLEARQRLGGRILTEEKESAYPIELGAEFVHGHNPRLRRVIADIPLPLRRAPSRHLRPRADGTLEPFPAQKQVEKVTRKIQAGGADESFQQFLERHSFQPEARRATLDYVEGFHAADPARFSVHGLAAAEDAARQIDGDDLHRVVGGFGGIIQWYENRLRKAEGRIMLGTEARSVYWHPGHVAVETLIGDDNETFHGNAAIVTLPLGVLKKREVRFDPAIPEKNRAIAEMEVGHVTKLVFRFHNGFWPEAFGFVHTFDDWIPTWWTNDDPLTLTGWAGGPRGERCAGARLEFLVERAVQILSRTFLKPPDLVRRAIDEVSTHNWTEDPFARMAYSYSGVHQEDAPRRLAEPIAETLFFAGEATSIDAQQGTVHGALDSGLRAAEEVKHCLRGVPVSSQRAVTP